MTLDESVVRHVPDGHTEPKKDCALCQVNRSGGVTPEELIDPVEFGEDLYGFRWGPVVVERTAEYRMGKAKEGRRMTKILTVYPDKGPPVELHVSSSGSSIRVFRATKDGLEELR